MNCGQCDGGDFAGFLAMPEPMEFCIAFTCGHRHHVHVTADDARRYSSCICMPATLSRAGNNADRLSRDTDDVTPGGTPDDVLDAAVEAGLAHLLPAIGAERAMAGAANCPTDAHCDACATLVPESSRFVVSRAPLTLCRRLACGHTSHVVALPETLRWCACTCFEGARLH
jgi:hypothetical protein